jgi:hypothetical protein
MQYLFRDRNAFAVWCCCTYIHNDPSVSPWERVLGGILLEELLGLVDLCGQIGTAAAVGVVQEHQRPVGFADLVLGDGGFAVYEPVSITSNSD